MVGTPSGKGKTMSLGNRFALSEAGYVAHPEPLITLRPRGGIPMTVHQV